MVGSAAQWTAPAPPQLDLGGIWLRWLNGGTFRLDGAAVFRQLPRPVWSTLLALDEDNRVGVLAHDRDVLAVQCRPDRTVASEVRAKADL
jgi:hypothetical protein